MHNVGLSLQDPRKYKHRNLKKQQTVSKRKLNDLEKLPPCHMLICTPRSRVLEKLTGLQLVRKFPEFYENRRLITAFTSARYLSLSWVITPYPTSWRSNFILFSHLRLVLPSGFSTKTLCTPLISSIRATCPVHLILFEFITRKIHF